MTHINFTLPLKALLSIIFGLLTIVSTANDNPSVSDSLTDVNELNSEIIDTLGETMVLDNLVFKTGSAKMDSINQMQLDKVASHLNSHPNIGMKIICHADSPGCSYFTFVLGKQRAMAITNYLISSGVEQYRLNALANGEDKSIPAKKTDTLNQLLGKVEIVFSEL